MPVIDADGVLVGIVTNRDIRFETDQSRLVREVMTPMPLVTAPVGVSKDDALALLRRHKVEKLPLVDEAGRLRGLITVKDFAKSEAVPARDQGRRTAGWWSAPRSGVGEDGYKRAMALVDAGRRRARGGHRARPLPRRAGDGRPAQAGHPRSQVVGGNVATRAGAQALVDAGRRRGQGRRRARARSAPPGSSPASACRRSPRSTRRRWPAARPACR